MSDDEDDPLEEEFRARCDVVSKPTEWLIHPIGDTDFEKGIRRGLELVLLTIRDQHESFNLWTRDDGSNWLCHSLYDNLTYRQDFTRVIQNTIDMKKGDDDAIRTFSAYLRAQADEVDKAIGWRLPRKRKALEKEP